MDILALNQGRLIFNYISEQGEVGEIDERDILLEICKNGEDPSKINLTILRIKWHLMRTKYELIGYVNEPLLKSTYRPGFNYHYAYQFQDKYGNKYVLKKEESYKLIKCGLVSNAKINTNNDGLIGQGCNLRDLKNVIPMHMEEYLSANELNEISSKLDNL